MTGYAAVAAPSVEQLPEDEEEWVGEDGFDLQSVDLVG
jgi:hypothetical protein